MRTITALNDQWLFFEDWADQLITTPQKGLEVCIPHAMKEMPLHYGNEEALWLISGYQRIVSYQSSWSGKRIVLRFEGVMAVAEVFVNGKSLFEHKGGYTHWTVDITDSLKEGDNLITVKVDSRERQDVPPFGAHIDYLCYNGIYREVELQIVDSISLNELLISQKDALKTPTITGHIRLYNPLKEKSTKEINFSLKDNSKEIQKTTITAKIDGSEYQDIPVTMTVDQKNITLWDTDTPKLYQISAQMDEDQLSRSFGFREAYFAADGFYLNGKKMKLRGLNRHQSYPYVGYAMPARVQQKDADILKAELGLNIVRTSHYPQSPHFLDRCDEIGLLVFEELPGWQYIGDLAWQDLSVVYVQKMIERDLHHPSIILWGVRINESEDNHDFYTKTNAMARKTDPTRQTGGVRYYPESELLEDVFTMNDFVLDGVREPLRGQREITHLNHDVPYLVTEYNGHMYPTKSYDQIERQVEHTKRHYQVLSASAIDENISGCIGWCAFDYHTHYDFGSGDRFCYHGVMDIFRNPKFAASAYKSQDYTKPFVEAITVWARGEVSGGGGLLPLLVSTNCDSVKVYFGKNYLGEFFPAKGRFPGLTHPPIIVEDRYLPGDQRLFKDEWGHAWYDGTIEGYKDGKHVTTQKFHQASVLHNLEIKADDQELVASSNGSTWDATRISVCAKDQTDNRLIFANTILQIKVEGGELIGPNLAALEGGSYAFWVKTTQKSDINITVSSPDFKTQNLTIKVK